VLGKKLVDATFQKAILDALIENVRELKKYPSTETIKTIYNGTTKGSRARRLLVDFWACRARVDWDGIKKLREDTSDEFSDDLLYALVQRREKCSARPWIDKPESYYTHVSKDTRTCAREPTSDTEDVTSLVLARRPTQQSRTTNALGAGMYKGLGHSRRHLVDSDENDDGCDCTCHYM
jgi:hypothetical protein